MTGVENALPLPGRAARAHAMRRLLRNPLGVVALVVLLAVVLGAVFADLVSPFDPAATDITDVLGGPSATHPFGTDGAGRDVLSRLLHGARTTLLAALLCAAVSIALGLPAGLVAGFYGGPFDAVSGWFTNLLMSLPAIIVLLSVRAAVGPSVWVSMVVFGIILSPGFFRLTRTVVQSVRGELYVDAARVAGLGDARIIARHVLSVVRAPLVIQAAGALGLAIGIQSGLDFLGLGEPGAPTWGGLLTEGFRNVYAAPLLILWPAIAIGLTIGSFALLGNALRDGLEDPDEGTARRRRGPRSVAPEPVAVPEAVPDDELLRVEGLAIGYPHADGSMRRVVEGVSFHVDRGEVLGIVGESGSGKSQTAFAILGLLPDSARILGGWVRFEGGLTVAPGDQQIVQERVRPLRGRRISYIPQEPMSNLDPAFTIGHQLSRPMVRVLGIPRAEARRRALALLADVGIADPARTFDAYPHEISGGMAQRVLIAGALSCEPDLIVADEPTTALDVTVQAEVLDLLREMQRARGVSVILVTHNFGVVADLADRVVVMSAGRVVETGSVREVLRNPRHEYTRLLLTSMLEGKEPLVPLLPGDEREGRR